MFANRQIKTVLIAIATAGLLGGVFSIVQAMPFWMWEKGDNFSSMFDVAKSVAVGGNFLYIAGFKNMTADCADGYVFKDNSCTNNVVATGKWVVEKRRIEDGELDKSFGDNGIALGGVLGRADAIAFNDSNNAVYVTGANPTDLGSLSYFYVYRLDTAGNMVDIYQYYFDVWPSGDMRRFSAGNAIAVAAPAVYIAGASLDTLGYPLSWVVSRIDGIRKSWTKTVPASRSGSTSDQPDFIATSLAVSGNVLYVAGYESKNGTTKDDYEWRIEARDVATGDLITSFGTNGVLLRDSAEGDYGAEKPSSIVADSTGIYISGLFGGVAEVIKLDPSGKKLVTSFGDKGVLLGDSSTMFNKLTLSPDGGTILVAGTKGSGWFLDAVDTLSGNMVWQQRNFPGVTMNGAKTYGAAIDGANNIYAVGYDKIPGNVEWRVEKSKTQIDAGDPIRAEHISNLRSEINDLWSKFGLALPDWNLTTTNAAGADDPIIAANQPIRAANILGLRENLFLLKGCIPSDSVWTNGISPGVPISKTHLNDISSFIDGIMVAMSQPGFDPKTFLDYSTCGKNGRQKSFAPGTVATWVVPDGVYSVLAEIGGGGGGGGGCAAGCTVGGGKGGQGGADRELFYVKPGDTINIIVGSGGGGGGSNSKNYGTGAGGGGGGASAIDNFSMPRKGGLFRVVAGGGGGGGGAHNSSNSADNRYGQGGGGGSNGGGGGGGGGNTDAGLTTDDVGGVGGNGGYGGGGGGGGGVVNGKGGSGGAGPTGTGINPGKGGSVAVSGSDKVGKSGGDGGQSALGGNDWGISDCSKSNGRCGFDGGVSLGFGSSYLQRGSVVTNGGAGGLAADNNGWGAGKSGGDGFVNLYW